MTRETFKSMPFNARTRVVYDNKTYPVLTVDFEECLICLAQYFGEDEEDCRWVRCESCVRIVE